MRLLFEEIWYAAITRVKITIYSPEGKNIFELGPYQGPDLFVLNERNMGMNIG